MLWAGWGENRKYYGACKLLTKSGDNIQPEKCETDFKTTKIQSEIVTASSDVEESSLAIYYSSGIHKEIAGTGGELYKIIRAKWECVFK